MTERRRLGKAVYLFRVRYPLDGAALLRFVGEVVESGIASPKAVIAAVRIPLVGNASLLDLLASVGTRLREKGARLIVLSKNGDVAAMVSGASSPGLSNVRFAKSMGEAIRLANQDRHLGE